MAPFFRNLANGDCNANSFIATCRIYEIKTRWHEMGQRSKFVLFSRP